MRRAIRILSIRALTGCSNNPMQSAPPDATTEMPAEWAFLGLRELDRSVDTTPTHRSVSTYGDSQNILETAVSGAETAGWTQARQKEIVGGEKVYFDREDGSILVITLLPQGAGAQLSVLPQGAGAQLSARIVPPEQ